MRTLERIRSAVVDTHVWVWAVSGDERAQLLEGFRGTLLLSAISVWEVAMLESKGRLSLRPGIDQWVRENLAPPFQLEPIHPAIAIESCRLRDFHGDPADRLIVATAIETGVPLITSDRSILEWNTAHARIQCIPLV